MILCKVIGNVTSTIKHPIYNGKKVLIVEPIDLNLATKGSSFLAIDSVHSGINDIVLVSREGNAARQIIGDDNAPVHSIILGVVDKIYV
jgi:ethanolamine utilization protein EutN